MKRPLEAEENAGDADNAKLLSELINRWLVRPAGEQSGGGLTYKQIIRMIYPVAHEALSKAAATAPKGNAPAVSRQQPAHVVISLDDQLEWQATMRSHSPKTPTPPMILKQLRETPPPSPKPADIENDSLPVSHLTPLEVMQRFQSSVISGILPQLNSETLLFPDGVRINRTTPTGLLIDDTQFDAGSLWLVVVAANTYESDIAAAARSRRGFVYAPEQQRKAIKDYLFARSPLSSLGGEFGESAGSEMMMDSLPDDSETILIRKRSALSLLQSRKLALEEQIERISAKIEQTEKNKTKKDVRSIVQGLIKRTAPEPQPAPQEPSPMEIPEAEEPVQTQDSEASAELTLLLAQELEAAVEYSRLSEELRLLYEQKIVLERKSKRYNLDLEAQRQTLKSALMWN